MTDEETEEELNKSDPDQNKDSEKKPDYSYAQQMRDRVTKVDQTLKKREEEKRKTTLSEEIRKASTVKQASEAHPLTEKDIKSLPSSEVLKAKNGDSNAGGLEKLRPPRIK